jgi:hypothetical protein
VRAVMSVTDITSSNVVGLYFAGTSVLNEVVSCQFHIVGGASNVATGIWNVGNGTIRSIDNHIHVTDSGGTSYSFVVGAAAEIISHFDDVIAADGTSVTTGGTLSLVYSPLPSTFIVGDDHSGLTLDKNSLVASGSDTNINITLTPKGVGTVSASRILVAAGTAAASTAPIKLTAGTVLGTPEAGTIEFDGTDYFLTV